MNETKEQALLQSGSVFSAIMQLALPSIFGQIIMVIYNIADTFFIGMTGSDAMVIAVTICMPAFMLLSAISNLFGIGGASVISRAMGMSKQDKARNAASFSFWFCALTAIFYCLIVFFFMNPLIDLLGGSDPAVHRLAKDYLRVAVILGGIPTVLNTFFAHLIRAEGRSLHASIGVVMGGVINMVLDPVFMFALLPKGQEVLGAAIATMISNVIALAYFLFVLNKNKHKSNLHFRLSKAMLSDKIPTEVLSCGLPACLMTVCENLSYAVLDNLMAMNGIAMQAGIGVAKKVNMLAHCIARGLSQGVLPLISYNYAAGNHHRMKQSITITMMISVLLSSLCMMISLVFANPLVELFLQGGGASTIYGAKFLRILALGGPFSACAYTIISFFQAVGKGFQSFVIAILRKGMLDIPLMLLIARMVTGYGFVWATPIADICCCIVAIVLFSEFLHQCTHPAKPSHAHISTERVHAI